MKTTKSGTFAKSVKQRFLTALFFAFSFAVTADTIRVCSFNIQFLGSSKKRDNAALATILKDYDIVVVQELIAPPFDGLFPDGTKYKPDREAAAFFQEMTKVGFTYAMSGEDTGSGPKNHINSSATEWW